MHIGISTGFLYEKSIFECVSLAKAAGFDTVEAWSSPLREGEYVHFNWHLESQVQALGVFIRDSGMKVHSLHAPFSPVTDLSHRDEILRRAAVEEVVRSMEVLKFLGGECLVVHPASVPVQTCDRHSSFAQSRKSIEQVGARASELGLKVAVENQLPHILGGDAETLLALIEGLPGGTVGVCFDTSHANLYPKRNVEEVFESLAGRVIAIHASDNRGRYDEHLAPGDGKIDWHGFIAALRRNAYPGVFMLESLSQPGQQELLPVLAALRERVEKMIS